MKTLLIALGVIVAVPACKNRTPAPQRREKALVANAAPRSPAPSRQTKPPVLGQPLRVLKRGGSYFVAQGSRMARLRLVGGRGGTKGAPEGSAKKQSGPDVLGAPGFQIVPLSLDGGERAVFVMGTVSALPGGLVGQSGARIVTLGEGSNPKAVQIWKGAATDRRTSFQPTSYRLTDLDGDGRYEVVETGAYSDDTGSHDYLFASHIGKRGGDREALTRKARAAARSRPKIMPALAKALKLKDPSPMWGPVEIGMTRTRVQRPAPKGKALLHSPSSTRQPYLHGGDDHALVVSFGTRRYLMVYRLTAKGTSVLGTLRLPDTVHVRKPGGDCRDTFGRAAGLRVTDYSEDGRIRALVLTYYPVADRAQLKARVFRWNGTKLEQLRPKPWLVQRCGGPAADILVKPTRGKGPPVIAIAPMKPSLVWSWGW